MPKKSKASKASKSIPRPIPATHVVQYVGQRKYNDTIKVIAPATYPRQSWCHQ